MKIETKFNRGDNVYYIHNNILKTSKVAGFIIQVGYFKDLGTWENPHYTYQLNDGYVGDNIFAKKEELINSL